MVISIELYEEWGQKWVYIADEGSSGCKYVYNDKEELKEIINDYVNDLIDNEVEDDE